MSVRIRRAAVAGSWYPGEPGALARELDAYLDAARTASVAGKLVALISPHAGLRYSGPVAAHGYSLLRGRRGLTLIVVGPAHRASFEGLAVWGSGAFETPLGPIPVDAELAEAMVAAHPLVRDLSAPHVSEHSLEMQLPFFRHLLEDARLVPVLMGTQSPAEVTAFVEAVGEAAADRDDVLLVASSDLSHYHPASVANVLDARVVDKVRAFDTAGLATLIETTWEHACGGGPMVAVMRAARARGADRSWVLRYADSGDAGEHDKSRVVGYLSAALTAAA